MNDRDYFAAAALTGLLVHANDGIDEETLDTPSDIAYTAFQMADAMLRERERTNHGAAPEARAQTEAAGISRQGAGDTPVAASATTAEPVAWIAVFDGDDADGEFVWPNEGLAREWASSRPGVEIAPLYLSPQPTLTDAAREAVRFCAVVLDMGQRPDCADTLRGLLERLK